MCQRTSHRHSIFCILPPQVLRSIAEKGTQQQREAVLRTLSTDTTFRALRASLAPTVGAARRRKILAVEPQKQRTIYTANNVETLPGTVVRSEGSGPSVDVAVDERPTVASAIPSISTSRLTTATRSTTKVCR